MAVEQVMFAVMTSLFGVFSILRVCRICYSLGERLLKLGEACVRSHAQIAWEHEHRVTLVAAAAILPPEGFIDRRADGHSTDHLRVSTGRPPYGQPDDWS